MEQAQNPTPTTQLQNNKAPIGIKIMAGLLLFIGLGIGVDVLLSGMSAFLFGGLLAVLAVIALILFLFTEKTAMSLFKLKPTSKRNYYIAVALDMVYLASKSSMGIYLLAKKAPPAQAYIGALLVALVGFTILALPFFLITKKHKELFQI
ncbi:MAG: hypothetical protein WC843_06770 [Candidatus Gracilibacteria bacterium]|jgi:hypothetical protein